MLLSIRTLTGLTILIVFLLSACSAGSPGIKNQEPVIQVSADPNKVGVSAHQTKSGAKFEQASMGEMVAFEGSVFVASTKPIEAYWTQAGWTISNESNRKDIGQVPDDCTLYKHLGVEDQWIGSCSGYTLVPKFGATNIAVVLEKSDGSSILVQVAPPPDSETP